jgi:hypothetical protein
MARKAAERISHLGDEVVSAFTSTDSAERVRKLQRVATRVLFEMHPVICWIERNRAADTAAAVTGRLNWVLEEVVECVRFDIPEYAGGRKRRSRRKHPSEGAIRTAQLLVYTRFFADSLRRWATDIEAADKQHALQAGTLSDAYIDSLSGQVMRKLARAVNGKGSVHISDVLKAVYGTSATTKLDGLLKAKDRFNAKLAADNKACELRLSGATLILSPV